jgi:hypothetical protein
MTIQAVLSGALSLWLGWLLYCMISRGKVSAIKGGLQATRRNTPIIYWGFVLLNGLILLNVLAVFVGSLGFRFRP